MNLNEDRQHLSYSQLSAMLSCPYKYYLQYVEKRGWDFVPSAVSFGSAIHQSIQKFHRDLMNGGIKGKSQYSEAFRTQFSEEAEETNVVFKDNDEFDSFVERGEALMNQYVDTFSDLKPSEVEMEFRLPLVNTYTGDLHTKDVVGKIDLITDDDRVLEFKTGASSMPNSAVDENLQLILYGWAFKMLFGEKPKKLVLVNLVKTKQPKIQILDTEINPEKERKLLHLMFAVNDAIEKAAFYPNPRGGFGCQNCSYYLSCQYSL